VKFKEKCREEGHFALYVPEDLSSSAIRDPSEKFMHTLKSMRELGFADKTDSELKAFIGRSKEALAKKTSW
jgi:hypothetical protein